MKKLHIFMLKSYASPFVATFFISMFVLLMQMLWRYIDELVGKGLEMSVIIELLFYFALTLVPMALPLGVLLSSIMTFGSLGENYELIALKSAGISLYRIMKPLIWAVVGLTIIAFLFSNNILPVANMRAGNLLYDIKRHKPELSFQEGVFTNDLEGYSIKVDKINKKTGMMYNLLIYNHKEIQGNYEVTRADSGMMISDPNNTYMELLLYHGNTYTDEGLDFKKRKTFPFRRLQFDKQSVIIELPGNELQRRDEDFVTSIMLNLTQLEYVADSMEKEIGTRQKEYANNLIRNNYQKSKNRNEQTDSLYRVEARKYETNTDSLFMMLDEEEDKRMIENALQYAREVKTGLKNDIAYYKRQGELLRKNRIEWHKKFTLPFACIIFFFIGAPLGGIIRKGGLGMPVVVSVLLFIVYYVISMIGERSAKEGAIPIVMGAWLSSFILMPLGIWLTYKSVTDSELMNSDAYRRLFDKVRKRISARWRKFKGKKR